MLKTSVVLAAIGLGASAGNCTPEPPDLSCYPQGECCPDGTICATAQPCALGRCDVLNGFGHCVCRGGTIDDGTDVWGDIPEVSEMSDDAPPSFWDALAQDPSLLDGGSASLAYFEEGCAQEISQACLYLSVLLARTLEATNAERGAELAEHECSRGNNQACFFYGAAFHLGVGVPHDSELAAAYFQQSCDEGYVNACEPLAEIERLAQRWFPDAD